MAFESWKGIFVEVKYGCKYHCRHHLHNMWQIRVKMLRPNSNRTDGNGGNVLDQIKPLTQSDHLWAVRQRFALLRYSPECRISSIYSVFSTYIDYILLSMCHHILSYLKVSFLLERFAQELLDDWCFWLCVVELISNPCMCPCLLNIRLYFLNIFFPP